MPRRIPPAAVHVLTFALLRARPFKADEPATRKHDRYAVRRAINCLCRMNILERAPSDGAARYRIAPLPAVALAAFRLLLTHRSPRA